MWRIVLALMLTLALGRVFAAEQIGPTYPVMEPDMIQEVQKKLGDMQRKGEVERLQKEFADRVRRHVETPDPVKGVTRTAKARTFFFDPSIRAPQTVAAPDGKTIVRAGETVNPLDYVSLSNHLLFFDARDPEQVEKAKALIARYEGRVKPILTGGAVMDLMRKWKLRVYFDQGGVIVRRFGIRHVPAVVSQDGKKLRIDELEV